MADDARRRILAVLLGHPAVVLPALIGMGGLAAAPFASHPAGIAFFGMIGLGMSILTTAFRATLGRDRVTEQVARELAADEARQQTAVEQKRSSDLETLRKDLLGDEDPRTETIFDDLRNLAEQFHEGRPWIDALDARAREETQQATQKLFDTSVQGLRDSLRIYQSAVQISHSETRARVLQQREALLGELQSSVATLGDMLAQLQELAVKSHSADDQTEARAALANHVKAAIQADQQMRQWTADVHKT